MLLMNSLQQKEEVILEPFRYLSQYPGKGIRTQLISAFNKWLNVDPKVLIEVADIIEMLHTSSLLIDDIEDNSKLRRGVPVAHLIYGVPATINCANYVYFLALDKCSKLGNADATKIFVDELIQLHRGQGFDIHWRDNNKCPTEEEYMEMVSLKTGGLFRLAVRMTQAFSENKTDFIPLVDQLGLYFQIRDDYINLQSEKYMESKSYCEDITEGKFSFPIIHSIHSSPGDNRLSNILKQRTEDRHLKEYAVTIMEKSGSFEYTKKALVKLKERTMEELKKLGGHPELEQVLQHLEELR